MALADSEFFAAPTVQTREPAKVSGFSHSLPFFDRHWLAQLPRLHHEARRNVRLTAFLCTAPQACLMLMAMGAIAVAMGSGSLKANFIWCVLVLTGIGALTRNYIRGFARSLRRVPLEEAAEDMRLMLLFTGAAWGAGAFMVMPAWAPPIMNGAFALFPSLGMAFLLKDEKGVTAFAMPAVLLTAGAGLAAGGGIGPAMTIVILGAAMACLPALEARRLALLHFSGL